jgi:hypothetical protein
MGISDFPNGVPRDLFENAWNKLRDLLDTMGGRMTPKTLENVFF